MPAKTKIILSSLKKKAFTIVLLFHVLTVSFLSAQENNQQPTIGLVLSGGGARGFAHIGVIKVLEEAGVDVDYVGGTSMGSIIGGLYAMGYSIYEIEKMALSTDWDFILNDKIDRRDLGFYEKMSGERYLLSLPISDKKVAIPPGLDYGQNVTQLLNKLAIPSYQSKDFSDLDKPFLCVATDLLSGKEVVMDTGSIALAIRASMSVPSAFAPVKYGNYYLVDGGLLNNFPAKQVSNLGADYLIGVDISTPILEKDEINNLVDVLSQSIFLNGEDTYQQNRKRIDFLLEPEIDPFTAISFNRADSLIQRGEQMARKMLPELKDFLKKIGHKPQKVRGKQNAFPTMDVLFVDQVNFIGNIKVSNNFLKRQLDIYPNDEVNIDELDRKITNLYGSKLFHYIYYEVNKSNSGETILNFYFEEASLFDINFSAHYNDYTKAGLLINITRRNFGLSNGRLSFDIALGRVSKIFAEYIVDKGITPGFGVNVDAFNQYGFVYEGSQKQIRFDFGVIRNQGFGLLSFKNIMKLRAGYEIEGNYISQDVSFIDFENFSNFSMNLFADFTIDSYNKVNLPTKGLLFVGIWETGKGNSTPLPDNLDDINDEKVDFTYTSLGFQLGGVIGLGSKFYFQPTLYLRKVWGEDVLFSKLNAFGGFQNTYLNSYLPFPGYDFMEIGGQSAFYPTANIRYNIWKKHNLLLQANALIMNLKLNQSLNQNETYYSWLLSYIYESPFGLVKLSMAEAYPKKHVVFDISLGFWF